MFGNLLKIFSNKIVLRGIVLVLILGGVYFSTYYYNQYQILKKNPNIESDKEIKELIAKISKFMVLPSDETPTVATVLDKEKIKDQPFFKNAENGDKLLAYTKAMKAILYRPSANRIIEVAPIYINNAQQVVAPTKQQAQEKPLEQVSTPNGELKIAYYNGTSIVGLATQAEQSVKNIFPETETSVITNAFKKDYTETLVIDLSGTHSKEVEDIAKLLKGKVEQFPIDETKPNTDILIIVGQQ